jgi:hypothetical protein
MMISGGSEILPNPPRACPPGHGARSHRVDQFLKLPLSATRDTAPQCLPGGITTVIVS